MPIQSLAVFCGSKAGTNPVYRQHAMELGHLLAEQNISLIYGGGNKGLMGAVANAVLESNGQAIGVIPEVLVKWEHQHEALTRLEVVSDMHVRKKMMYDLCDAAVILPGGFGTLDELFEMLTWNQLSIHDKKICLLNSDGFYEPLIAHLRMMEEQGFLYDSIENRIHIANDPLAVFEMF
jgi:uncharacterized protein (TIGR00730 family)